MHQIVPLRIDPFEPTAAELAGDEPPSEHDIDIGTERQAQACTRLLASRAITPKGTFNKPNQHHVPLADTG
eukprot:scaffold30528_cov174-Isochrysis_galbana.AAC.1